ncbi:MAG: 2-oxoglutarate/2-oxoacid ferredoxin oxidoreductase subunit alpha [Cyanobacteriota bacterium erpe_2018_sw_21hr_WHONDRS-SW48-000092_B_bin.40]|nr:2-oxoglutarate/2-oxoacid ferredoxin oxidoreductase subunit alpha [Cyanobacteriota bacterium erpe_2018_sw_21hr_WHONDRS-SW48-000092_B_bin.40]
MKTLAADSKEKLEQGRVVNDFSIQVATVNGSGSQSSNSVLMRSIFQMGIPVSGKNLFPSNIAGLPTWFTIRVNKNGYVARKSDIEILVAMNPQTAIDDVKSLSTGAVCISPVELKLDAIRKDVLHYQVPFTELAAKASENLKLRKLLMNMLYVGVVAELLNIDHGQIENSISKQFEGKTKAIDLNLNAVKIGREWARENLKKEDPYFVEPMDKTQGKIIIDGNAACALGSLFAGVTVVTWYPITPSSSLCEQLIDYLKDYRIDKETGKASFAVIQAEDELAAIGMALGAGWAGARSMTSTSGPGISLMAEFTGYGYFTEIPTVIFDVQRVGPSTGMPTRTSQADLISAYTLSHGDTKHIVLLPGSIVECYEMAGEAFELAEQFQTPVFVLTDLDLGMNNWMSDPFEYPTKPISRGKVMTAADIEKAGKFERYRDVDGDGIPYRTLPGTDHPQAAYFTRGSGHNEKAGYTEKPEDYVNLMDRLEKKFQTARKFVPAPVVSVEKGAKIGIIAFGSSDFAVIESRDQLKAANIPTSYLRVRALPFTDDLRKFVETHDHVYVVEQNRDAQMRDLIRLELPELAMKIRSVKHYDGLPIDARFVTDAIMEQER